MSRKALRNIFIASLLAWTLIGCACAVCKAASIWPDSVKVPAVRDLKDYYVVKVDIRKVGQVDSLITVTLDTTWAKKQRIEFTKGITFRLTPGGVDSLTALIRHGLVGLPTDSTAQKYIDELVKVK